MWQTGLVQRRRDQEAARDEATELPGEGSEPAPSPVASTQERGGAETEAAPGLALRADGLIEGLEDERRARSAAAQAGPHEGSRFGPPGDDAVIELATPAPRPDDAADSPEPLAAADDERASADDARARNPGGRASGARATALRRAAWLLAAGVAFTAFLLWQRGGGALRIGGDGPGAVRALTPLEETLGIGAEVPLVVMSTPPGATLRLDGREVGVTPWAGNSPGGAAVELELELRGYVTHRRRIDARQELHLDVSLERR